MKPWQFVDSDPVPDDDGTIVLMCRSREYVIHVDGRELMSTGLHGSEDALSDLACDRLDRLNDARILVGGLGVGFTLAQALRRVGDAGEVTVAELMPAVIRWNHEYLGRKSGHPLKDSRVTVYCGDVVELVETPPARWSAILLDVDNGPRSLTRPTNGWLYTRSGLASARDALIDGGVLGIWSHAYDRTLTSKLRRAKFDVEVVRHHEPGRPTKDGTGTHELWMAKR